MKTLHLISPFLALAVLAASASLQAPAAGVAADKPREGKASPDGAQLYNLRQDIGEEENLAERNQEKLRELVAVWEGFDRGMIDPLWRDGPAEQGTVGKGQTKAAKE